MGEAGKSSPSKDSKFDDEIAFEDLKQDSQISLPNTSALEGVNYLFGHLIAHFLSPLLHQTVYNEIGQKWSQISLDLTSILYFVSLTRDLKLFGASVTMPHKMDILPFLDELTEEARDIGACNTIYMRERDGSRTIGANTDCFGVRDAFLENLPEGASKDVYRGRPGLIVGRGGSCRSAIYALRKWLRCHPIYVVNRDTAKVEAMLSDYQQLDPESKHYLIHVKTTSQAENLPALGSIVSYIPNITPTTLGELNARSVIETFLGKEKGAILEM